MDDKGRTLCPFDAKSRHGDFTSWRLHCLWASVGSDLWGVNQQGECCHVSPVCVSHRRFCTGCQPATVVCPFVFFMGVSGLGVTPARIRGCPSPCRGSICMWQPSARRTPARRKPRQPCGASAEPMQSICEIPVRR